jgi:lipopolysaccharide export system permease protein
MTRLDRYILHEHLGPFLFALVVITLVLIVDFIPDVVNMVVAKGLPAGVIVQVFVLNLAWMFALAVPMAVLSGTLMAFGRLATDSETIAMKAAGLSLYRLIFPVLIIASLMSVGLVYFNNDVLPDANHEARRLMSDIRRKRPTLDLKSNVLEDRIPGYHLLIKHVDEKSSDIADITIFDHKNRAEPRTVTAKTGTMRYSEDGMTLILDLRDGEIHEPDPEDNRKYRRTAFEHQTFYLGGAGDEWTRTESEYRNDREKSAAQMRADMAEWQKSIDARWHNINSTCSAWVSAYLIKAPDSPLVAFPMPTEHAGYRSASDTANARQRASERAARVASMIDRETAAIDNQQRLIDSYEIEVYKKYSIPVACIVFTLIGCPLGVGSRRGGIAAGLGVSIGLFLLYWTFLIGGEDLADREFISPGVAMWSADVLIGVAGLLLLWAGTNEISLSPRALWGRLVANRAISARESATE